MSKTINTNALFLGPKSENSVFFKEMIEYAVNEHIHWRTDFHPEDKTLVTPTEKYKPDFRETLYKTEEILQSLSSRLKTESVPWFSPRYLGHMNADTFMVSNIAYIMTMLYNPNNCAYEASPVTTDLEIEAGLDLCMMFGYQKNKSWGHITSGGTVANYEALWLARNLKSIPLAMNRHPVAKNYLHGIKKENINHLSPEKTLDLIDALKKNDLIEEVIKLSVRGTGIDSNLSGKILVPRSKHYSWMKAVDILGLGLENLITMELDSNYRTDVEKMRSLVFSLMEENTPILALIAVVGTTEEGSIDPIHEFINLRKECEVKFGKSFYIHIDGAYGGYARSLIINENGDAIPYSDLESIYSDNGIVFKDKSQFWPKLENYNALLAMKYADSITVDPHKSGYVPYAAGAITMKDKRITDLISYHAAYVFEDDGKENDSELSSIKLGSAIMEGSKAGATASAVWAAHRLVPLNILGHGRVLGRSISTTAWLADKINNLGLFILGSRKFSIHLLMQPDFNMVNFTFKEEGEISLSLQNDINKRFYQKSSYSTGRTFLKNFITSSTSLSEEEYGIVPKEYVLKLGFSDEEWQKEKSVYILRATIMTHCLDDDNKRDDFWGVICKEFRNTLKEIVDEDILKSYQNKI